MSECIVVKDEAGQLRGLGEKADRAYQRFRKMVAGMAVGETLRFSFWQPRSPAFHKRHFAILGRLFDAQEAFVDDQPFREWVQVGAGFCDILPGPKGKPVAISRSIAWDKLDDADFADHHHAVIAFVRSTHFHRYLWPHLGDAEGSEMVEAILSEFEA